MAELTMDRSLTVPNLSTPRLELVPAILERLAADLEGPASLSRALDAAVPAGWPPPLYDRDAVEFAVGALRDGDMHEPWCFYYVLLTGGGGSRTAIGAGGFKGRPSGVGEVEVGYSILPAFQRRGFAGEALRAWVDLAFGRPDVSVIVAQTLPGLRASVRVAESAGFELVGPGEDGKAPPGHEVLRYELRRSPRVRG
jgi:RimJ/RimL family protein N-acetyltransferase